MNTELTFSEAWEWAVEYDSQTAENMLRISEQYAKLAGVTFVEAFRLMVTAQYAAAIQKRSNRL